MWRSVGLALVFGLLALLPRAVGLAEDTGVVVATITVARDISIELSVPERKVMAGNPFHVEARITSPEGASGELSLRHPHTILLRDAGPTPIDVRPGKTTVVRWSVCSETAGMHVILASFESVEGAILDSNAELVDITGKKKTAQCPRPWRSG
ncbi:MAG: hypothetical protein WD557_11485 [Dehalococcoidia bacterium]